MRRFTIKGLALVAVLAVGAMSASGANAAKPNLLLREGGEHPYEGLDPVLTVGAPVEATFETPFSIAGGCVTTAPIIGELTANSAPLDTFFADATEFKNTEEVDCADEYEGHHDEMTFRIDEVGLSSKGKIKPIVGHVTIIVWGPYGNNNSAEQCPYRFELKKSKPTVKSPTLGHAGETVVKGTGRSEGRPGIKACPKKEEMPYTLTLADNAGYPLEMTLEG